MTFSTMHQTELVFPPSSNYHHDTQMLNEDVFVLSATSQQEQVCRVFQAWKADQDDIEIMDVDIDDDQLSSTLLGDSAMLEDPSPCLSPTGPLEELVYLDVDVADEKFFAPNLVSSTEDIFAPSSAAAGFPFNNRYQDSLKKLEESMRRSRETRASLTIKTERTEKYLRSRSIDGVLSQIEDSSEQLQGYLKTMRSNSI